MKSRWAQLLGIFAAVVVVVAGIVVVASSTNSDPGAGARPTTTTTTTTSKRRPRPTVDTGCRLGRGPVRLVDVPQQVTDRVNAAWERIERWLASKAPKTAATLQPPATDGDIALMQQQTGVPVPPELVAFLRRHNGTGTSRGGFTLPPFYQPMSTEQIIGDAKMMCGIIADSESLDDWWHGQVIPFAEDGGGGNLLLDQRKGRGGRLGEHFEDSAMMFDRHPATLTELLELTATSLETGQTVLRHYRPKVVAGELDWDIN